MSRVLLTGATGFIGRNAVPLLLSSGYEVHAAVSRPPAAPASGIGYHHVDLLDVGQITALVATVQPTHLLHFAWYTAHGKYWAASQNLQWVQASLCLLQAFVSHGGERVVMAGTCAEYDWQYGFCSEQLTPLTPATLYGTCKHALQVILTTFARQTGVSSAWGRIFYVYGPHEHPDRLVPSVIRSLARGTPARCSAGTQIRDFLHVHDVARAFVALLGSSVTGAVNIASGQPTALKQIVYAIADKLAARDLVHLGALVATDAEPPVLLADVRRLAHEVGWSPHCDLDRGLTETIAWWQARLQVDTASDEVHVSRPGPNSATT